MLRRLHVLSQIKPDMSQDDSLSAPASRVLLEHLEMDAAFLQRRVPPHHQPHRGFLLVPELHPVVADRTLGRPPPMFRRVGRWQVPFDETRAGH